MFRFLNLVVAAFLLFLGAWAYKRTQEEFCKLFEAGGFKLTRLIPTESRVSIVERVPA